MAIGGLGRGDSVHPSARQVELDFYKYIDIFRYMDIEASVFKALGDSTRLEIIRSLLRSDELACGTVLPESSLSQSVLSYHFRVLREADLIVYRKQGQERRVSVNRETFERFLPGLLRQWEEKD